MTDDIKIATKCCTKCRRAKPLNDFHVRRRNPDGRMECCKICNRAAAACWVKTHPDHAAKTRKVYANSHRDECNAATRKYKEKNPRKRAVHTAFYNAQRLGHITFDNPICAIRGCGDERVEAHHTDYSKIYEVVFMCKKHHTAWHKYFIAEE